MFNALTSPARKAVVGSLLPLLHPLDALFGGLSSWSMVTGKRWWLMIASGSSGRLVGTDEQSQFITDVEDLSSGLSILVALSACV